MVVDAPPDPEDVAAVLAEADLYPAAVLVTHGHVDHVGGAGELTRRTGISAYLHPDDDWLAADPEAQLRSLFGAVPDNAAAFAPPDRFIDLAHGESLEIGGLVFDVLHTPGHTPGHCCFHLSGEGILFSGDQLFAGAVGRWDLPGGDYRTLMDSMRTRILPLPAATDVLPGHGPATTLARELATNPFLLDLHP